MLGDDDDDDDTEAHARNSDPSTSHDAAQRVRFSKLQLKVLNLLRLRGEWMTSIEISEALGIHVWSISPRMKPLLVRGLVENRKMKGDNSNGKERLLLHWRATSDKPVQLELVLTP